MPRRFLFVGAMHDEAYSPRCIALAEDVGNLPVGHHSTAGNPTHDLVDALAILIDVLRLVGEVLHLILDLFRSGLPPAWLGASPTLNVNAPVQTASDSVRNTARAGEPSPEPSAIFKGRHINS